MTTAQIDALVDQMVRRIAASDHPRARAVADAVARAWEPLRRRPASALTFDDFGTPAAAASRPHWDDARRPRHGKART